MGAGVDSSLVFLITAVFEFYIMIVIMRLMLSYFRANFYNPLSQLVIKLTGPLVKPLQKITPGYKGIDFAVVVLLILLEMVKLTLITLVGMHAFPNIVALVLWAVAETVEQFLKFYIFAIIGRVILSWVGSGAPQMAPIQEILYLITEPLMAPARRIIPPISGFDLSPLGLLLLLQATSIMLGYLVRPVIIAALA